jgi:cytochrome c oxidase cbb3-type subunit III
MISAIVNRIRSFIRGMFATGGWLRLATVVVLLVLAGAAWALRSVQRSELAGRLLATPPEEVALDDRLVRLANEEAKPLFATHCASCHGADMKGDRAHGTPNLTDAIWLYGNGSIYHIERTILYGIRSGHPKSHDVADMTPFGQRGLLTPGEIRSVVQFVLQLSQQPYQAEAATEGAKLFGSKGQCYDCHAQDARGNSDYGAPDLTANVWSYGGDAQSLYNTIYFGRHGVCPAWLGPLDLEQIRALAVYIYSVSHPEKVAGR